MTIGMLTGGYIGLLALGWWLAHKIGTLQTRIKDLEHISEMQWYTERGFTIPYEDALHQERWPLPTKEETT